jgi:hypothetical protein
MRADASFRGLQKRNHVSCSGIRPYFSLRGGKSLLEGQSRRPWNRCWRKYTAVEGADGRQILSTATVPLKPYPIKTMNLGSVTLSHEIRRNILTYHGPRSNHGHVAETDELVNTGEPSDNHTISDNNVTSQRRAICEYASVSNEGIVADMGIGHEEILVADLCNHSTASRTGLKSDALANDIAVPDDQLTGLSAILEVLRDSPNGRKLKYGISVSDRCMPFNHHMRTDSVITP